MPRSTFDSDEARTELSELVDRTGHGEEIVISKAGQPVAKLVPIESPSEAERKPGGWEGKVWVADDFDAPLPDELQSAFEGRSAVTQKESPGTTKQ